MTDDGLAEKWGHDSECERWKDPDIPYPVKCGCVVRLVEKAAAQAAEIARLNEERSEARIARDHWFQKWEAQAAEIARLKASPIHITRDPTLNEEVDALTAEIARLREALTDLMAWGVEMDDPRMKYIVVQIDRPTLAFARAVVREEGQG